MLRLIVRNQAVITQNQEFLMTESQQLGQDVAQVKADVAAANTAALAEIQQVLDGLASAAANATELADLKAAVNDAHTQLAQTHTDLTNMTTSLQGDDQPVTPPAP